MKKEKYCYICYSLDIDDFGCDDEDCYRCDMCEQFYCQDCSYTFGIYYQHEGPRCYRCADQSRRKNLTKEEIRDNRIKLIGEVLNGKEFFD